MEKLPSVVSVEDKEKEISHEKRSKMWETVRIAALAGSVLFWGGQAMRQIEKGHTPDNSKSGLTDFINFDMAEYGARNIQDIKRGETEIVDGKKVLNAELKMAGGRVYKTRIESNVEDDGLSAEEGSGRIDWNTADIKSINEDGSGVYVMFDATSEGLKMTIKELGLGGKVLNERVSIIQEMGK